MATTEREAKIEWRSPAGLPLLRIRAGRQHTVTLGCQHEDCYVHWVPEIARTMPCVLGSCVACVALSPRRAMTYAACLHWRMHGEKFSWCPALLEVPWTTGKMLLELPREPLALRRERPNGPVNVGKFLFDMSKPVFDGFDVLPVLFGMWRLPASTMLARVGNLGPAAD